MSPAPTESRQPPPARRVHLRLDADRATSETTLLGPGGASTVLSGPISYRTTPHGLSRWTDPDDGLGYVIGSGALGGAGHFLTGADGPADRMPTVVTVDPVTSHDVIRSTSGNLASHHVGLVAGPWKVHHGPGLEVLARQSLNRDAAVAMLLGDMQRARDWLLDWFGAAVDAAPWGATYTQVLVPRAPWLAMEHPGCVLVSERLLDLRPGRRMAVLAHEAAHQWVGNLVSPRTWPDVGVFEGLAELLGQLAAAELTGPAADADLARRRTVGPLSLPPTGPDLRTLATTASLAEVAGPVQHAEALRTIRAKIGAEAFRIGVGELIRRHAGAVCSAAEVWAALDATPEVVPTVRLPLLQQGRPAPWLAGLDEPDPATAVLSARRAFRACSPGPARVREALAAVADPGTPPPVTAGLAAELSRFRGT